MTRLLWLKSEKPQAASATHCRGLLVVSDTRTECLIVSCVFRVLRSMHGRLWLRVRGPMRRASRAANLVTSGS